MGKPNDQLSDPEPWRGSRGTPLEKFESTLSRGGGVHNMLRVRVCAAHMGGFLGPKFSKQGSLFRQIFHKQGWVIQKMAKNGKKMGGFPPKFVIKVGMTASFGN